MNHKGTKALRGGRSLVIRECGKALVAGLLMLLAVQPVSGDTKPVVGIRDNTPAVHALTNARIVTSPGKVIARGTVVLRDGLIEAVGADVRPPQDARVWDLEGQSIYPGLIEPYAEIGLSDVTFKKGTSSHWNTLVHPEFRVRDVYSPTNKELKELRSLGFTAAHVVPTKGTFRGQGSVVGLGSAATSNALIQPDVAQHLAFERQRASIYPRSLMGVIALIRQTLLDADWYARAAAHESKSDDPEFEHNVSLESLAGVLSQRQPVLFESRNVLDQLRALEIAGEHGLKLWIRGWGDEYRELPRLPKNARYLLPLNFPGKPSVNSLDDELNVSLIALQHWELAPTNARQLHEARIPFVLTSSTLKSRAEFAGRLVKAIEEGLPENAALAALTTGPATMLGVADQLGTIEKGKRANLVVTEGKLLATDRTIRDVWIDGKRFEVTPKPEVDPTGEWTLTVETGDGDPLTYDLKISGSPSSLEVTVQQDTVKVKAKSATLDRNRLSLVIPGEKLDVEGSYRAVLVVRGDRLSGTVESPGLGIRYDVTGVRSDAESDDVEDKKSGGKAEPTKVTFSYPPGSFGRPEPPSQPRHVVVKNATIWTAGPQGTIQGDLLIENGVVVAVGPDLDVPTGAETIDGTGKHVTPGLIDCHSHQGTQGGVNEGTQAVSCEVRIADVVYPWDVDIYRMLAGGLTTMNVLHGSSNPIGGQNAVLKLRWGRPAKDLLLKGAQSGVKFALGENVKRSNWRTPSSRYPRSRMGVEQIIRDRFQAAREYRADWRDWEKNKKRRPMPRRDLETEALVEMIEGERLVHCHSYRQDEILMLIRVADDFGFRIGTFQHVLEGYKVADEIAKHGAGASSFSDWWAYKFEVFDAISYNGALMHHAGVNVSFNSDSGELARRMNLEAAKAVKDGGVSEEEALKFVTLNPAIQLGIDDRVGSLEKGKDGDFVIWSGHPLSTYSKCEQTWIDGARYFSLEENREMVERDYFERQRLVQKALGPSGGTGGAGDKGQPEGQWYGEGIEEHESCHDHEHHIVDGRLLR